MIRKLTSDEIAKSKAARDAANAILNEQRKALTERINKMRRKSKYPLSVSQLEKQRNSIDLITGLPVLIYQSGQCVIVNYEFLQRFIRRVQSYRISVRDRLFDMHYHAPGITGQLILLDLPTYQTDLLHDLPIVEIGE